MTDLLRTSLPRRQETPATALVVAPDPTAGNAPETVALFARRHRREQLIGRFTLDAAGRPDLRRTLSRRGRRVPVVLRVAPDLLLEREVTLPLAAEPDIGNVLRYSIDTLTPFAAQELFWNWTVTLRDRAQRLLHLRFSLVCKSTVEPLIAALRQAGATPKLLEFPLTDTETRAILLGDTASRGARLRPYALPAVGGCVAGVVLAVAVLPIVLQARALAVTEARIDALRPRVALVAALRSRLADDAGSSDVITRERGRVGNALQVIAVITDALPDDTWLTELSLRGRKLALTGESGAAAKLIVTLSAEPMLRNTNFVAPVTRAPTGGRDVFSIETEVIP